MQDVHIRLTLYGGYCYSTTSISGRKAKFLDHVLYYPERKLYPVPENRLVKYFACRNMISARQYTSLNDYNTLTVVIAEYTLDHSSCYKNVFNGLNLWNANIDTKYYSKNVSMDVVRAVS